MPPRGAQPHIDLVKLPVRHRRCHSRHQRLGQPREIGPRCQRARTFGGVRFARIIDHDEIEVRSRIEPLCPERPHSQDDRSTARNRSVLAGKLLDHDGPKASDDRLREIGIFLSRLFGSN